MASVRGLMPLGAATAAMLGAMFPDDAQAMVSPKFKETYIKNFYDGIKGHIDAGTFEPEVFAKILAEYPNAQNVVKISPHAAGSRFDKQGWSPERTADAIAEMLNSSQADIVANWQKKPVKGTVAKHGALLPKEMEAFFTPFVVGSKDGGITLTTAFEPSEKRLKKLGYGVEGGNPLISSFLQGQSAKASSQRQPISAVTPQPVLENKIRGLENLVKKGGAGTGITIGATLGNPQEAWASYVPREKGLEEPAFDPVSMLTAPIGVAGAGAKAIATALDPAINAMMQSLFGE